VSVAEAARIERRAGRAHVLFTARADGNLSTLAGLDAEHGAQRRERLARELALRRLCAGPQVHGTDVDVISSGEPRGARPLERPADARITALSEVGAMVLAADCMPIALIAGHSVGAVHAGWRGLAAGVLEAALARCRELDGLPVSRAVIGPSAGPCCYEVGPDVFASFGLPGAAARTIDLRAIAVERLEGAGVGEVEVIDRCTICDERYFSHRREGALAGRQAVILWRS
jgi:YfiH family protein